MNKVVGRRVERALRAALILVAAALAGASAILGALAWRSVRQAKKWDAPPRRCHLTVRDGLIMMSDPRFATATVPQRKEAGELRIFVLGSSQAMGAPYVLHELAALARLELRVNEGGLSTWLERYLARAFPRRRVRVVNAAAVATNMSEAVDVMADAVNIGQADAVVLLTGGNDRLPGLEDGTFPPDLDLAAAIDALTQRCEANLARAAKLSEQAHVRLYALTEADNLRDWWPVTGGKRADPSEFMKILAEKGPQDAWRYLSRYPFSGAQDPLRWAMMGKILDQEGRFAQARRAFIKAKDLDWAFVRVRSPWNDAIRRLRGPLVSLVDAEELLAGYASDRVPGNEFFHDSCHLTLNGNRILGFEVARRIAADLGADGTALRLADVSLDSFVSTHLKVLYALMLKCSAAARSGLLGPTGQSNAAATARTYARAARAIKRQIGTFHEERAAR